MLLLRWGANDDFQLGLGQTFGRKVNRPEVVVEMSGKGVLRVAAGRNFCLALTEAGDVYSWGGGHSSQLGHGSKSNEEYPRLIETLREVRRLGAGAAAEHAAALVAEQGATAEDEEEDDEGETELKEAEEQLEKARGRREDVSCLPLDSNRYTYRYTHTVTHVRLHLPLHVICMPLNSEQSRVG